MTRKCDNVCLGSVYKNLKNFTHIIFIMANTPPAGTQFAIPNTNTTTNTLVVNGEPGTWQCVATGQSQSNMNGTYSITGSHFFSGSITVYNAYNCFGQNGLPFISGGPTQYGGPCWQSRSASNNYASNATGTYQGSTSKVIGGNTVMGEYVSITAPYSFVLTAYCLISANYNGATNPASGWVIGGSNNGGTTYALVDSITNTPLPLGGFQVFTLANTVSYSSYIIVITNVPGGGSANIGTWNLYTPSSNSACFTSDATILCKQDDRERYVPICQIRKGDWVKTV